MAGDIGARLSVRLTGTRQGYRDAVVETAAIGPVEPGQLNPARPVVTGAARVRETLTARVDPWGPGAVRLAWQWFRGDTAISGATSTTYRLVAADAGATIRVRVRGTAANFATANRWSERTGVVAPGLLDPTPVPLYHGTAQVRKTVTALPGSWGPGQVTLRYQWFRSSDDGDVAIEGATGESIRIPASLEGRRLRVRVTGSRNGFETVRRFSGYTSKVAPGDLEPGTPVLSGHAVKGRSLQVDPGEWGPGEVGLTIRWYRDGLLQTKVLGDTYDLGEADVGHRIVARVLGSRAGFADAVVESDPSEKVVAKER